MTGGAGSPVPARDSASLALALLRVAVTVLLFAGATVLEEPRVPWASTLVAGAALLYSVGALLGTLFGRGQPRLVRYAAADLVLLGMMVCFAGNAFSGLRLVFAAFAFMAAVVASPRQTAAWALLAPAVYVLASLLSSTGDQALDVGSLTMAALGLVWTGAFATALAIVLTRRSDHIHELASSRRVLVAQALDAETSERRRLANVLHDQTVQMLLCVRQDLAAARQGDDDALQSAQLALEHCTAQLRDAMFELHPYLLERGGLGPALRALAEQQGRRGPFSTEVTVDEDAVGPHDELVYSVARELLINAARHSGARRVTVNLARDQGAIDLVVADDGVGFPPARISAALEAGHIGLASSAERLAALGGALDIEGRPGLGTRVRAHIPDSVAHVPGASDRSQLVM